jgi:hypothetical protein
LTEFVDHFGGDFGHVFSRWLEVNGAPAWLGRVEKVYGFSR